MRIVMLSCGNITGDSMATIMSQLHLEKAHFENFKQHLPGYKTMCEKTLAKLMKLGILEVSTAFERAISKVGKIKVISEDQADFDDDSDAKLTSVRTFSSGKGYSAQVSGLKNKIGTLRIQCYERKTGEFYYFKIPSHGYKHQQTLKTPALEIPFNLDGTPRRKPLGWSNHNMWEWEVSDFKEMAT
jgi:hypothetical protein